MKYGEVVERGNHEQLLKMNGVYKNLVGRQMVSQQIKDELEKWEKHY